ncbi:hypothetical protein IHP33_04105 [Enterococcus faecalis]|uniref:hypothetical protein n=1 Tax=Enterococcus faecalis TaxID=1351 RepID=UPI0017865A41|nr:hypothetical protein [Enterococcus faecalis]MBD9844902.1 hypothetical protein [Enterococcus faecalis]
MERETSILSWVIYTVLIGAIIFAVAKVAFPELTQQVFDHLKSLIPSVPTS